MAIFFIITNRQNYIEFRGDNMQGNIYCITNLVNNKKYIGKTLDSIEKRYKQHWKDSVKTTNEKRPLYSAFKKYGKENFKIELVEKCDYKVLSEHEIYWIKYYDTYNKGYNATLGGDGKILYNYEEIVEKFKEGLLVKELTEYFECDKDTIKKALEMNNINPNSNALEKVSHKVQQLDKSNNLIRTFSSYKEAARWLIDNNITSAKESSVSTNISRVVRGLRKTCCGFKWKEL